MSPDQIPQKEGEPASEVIAGAIQAFIGMRQINEALDSSEDWTSYEFDESEAATFRALLEQAKQRAVAQEAEGRRLRKHLELADEVIGHFTWCRFCGEDSPKECGVGGENYRAWQARFSPPEGGAALSGSSETPTTERKVIP